MLKHQFLPFAQDRGSLAGRFRRPALLCGMGRPYGLGSFAAAEIGDRGDDIAVHRIEDVDGCCARQPVSVHVTFVLEERLILKDVAQRLAFTHVHAVPPLFSRGGRALSTGDLHMHGGWSSLWQACGEAWQRGLATPGKPIGELDKMSARAVVFDLDGTLVDTAPDLTRATNHVLALHGRKPVSNTDVKGLVGFGARALIRRGFAATGDPVEEDQIEKLFRLFLEFYAANIAIESVVYPGTKQLLDLCRESGIRLGICTNKPEALSRALIGGLGLSSYFGAIVGMDTISI